MSTGIQLGPYTLIKRLALGGMAEIFLARKEGPEGFARELVVKRILPHLTQDQTFVSMFLDEARIAARLSHPNVVNVYDFGEADGRYYLAMEFVRGVDLKALMFRSIELVTSDSPYPAVPPHHAAKILSLVCEGLAHAHALSIDGHPVGLVHRDITPSNVLVSFEGAVKIADFGIAKAERELNVVRENTAQGMIKGKHAYMSPEQARGERLDSRSDLFNVGILLFEAVLGEPLFPQEYYRLCKELSGQGIIPEAHRIDRLPHPLPDIVRRALAPKREDRYSDALSLRADLEAFLRGWPEPSDAVELGRYARELFPEAVSEEIPRAAGTMPMTGVTSPAGRPHDVSTGGDDARIVTTPNTAVVPAAQNESPLLLEPEHPLASVSSPPMLARPSHAGVDAPTVETRPRRNRRRNVRLRMLSGAAAVLAVALLVLFIANKRAASNSASAQGQTHIAPLPKLRLPETPTTSTVDVNVPRMRDSVLGRNVLSTARLRVLTIPSGANVRIDGQLPRESPIDAEVSLGVHHISVALTGYLEERRSITLQSADEISTLKVVLQPIAAGARQPVQPIQPVRPLESQEPARTRSVRQPAPVARNASAPAARAARAQRANGKLAVFTLPWSEVFLGTRSLGTTPLANVDLPAGRHVLTMRAPNKPIREISVIIRPGRTTRVREEL